MQFVSRRAEQLAMSQLTANLSSPLPNRHFPICGPSYHSPEITRGIVKTICFTCATNACVCVCVFRHTCEILQVHSPHSSTNGAPASNGQKSADGNVIVISDSDDEEAAAAAAAAAAFQSPGRSKVYLAKSKVVQPVVTTSVFITRPRITPIIFFYFRARAVQ